MFGFNFSRLVCVVSGKGKDPKESKESAAAVSTSRILEQIPSGFVVHPAFNGTKGADVDSKEGDVAISSSQGGGGSSLSAAFQRSNPRILIVGPASSASSTIVSSAERAKAKSRGQRRVNFSAV